MSRRRLRGFCLSSFSPKKGGYIPLGNNNRDEVYTSFDSESFHRSERANDGSKKPGSTRPRFQTRGKRGMLDGDPKKGVNFNSPSQDFLSPRIELRVKVLVLGLGLFIK